MRTIVISGARKGIGRFLAEYYLARDYQVVGCSRSSSDLAHPRYKHFACDVTMEEEVLALFNILRNTCESIDVLINNAGVASMNHSLLTPGSTARKIIDTNFYGTFLMSRECAKVMQLGKWGRIVNFVSVALPLKLEGEAVYASSKAAVLTLTQILASEYASFGITVNAVGPAPTETDLIRGVSEEKIAELVQKQAIKRLGFFRDISNVVDFFISSLSDFVTGQVIYLGGV